MSDGKPRLDLEPATVQSVEACERRAGDDLAVRRDDGCDHPVGVPQPGPDVGDGQRGLGDNRRLWGEHPVSDLIGSHGATLAQGLA